MPENRRARITADVSETTGIDEDVIHTLVHAFYAQIRQDPVLGPIFNDRIDDWEPHLERMCAFWSSVTLMSGRYHGQPMQKHAPLPVDARHFDRWLELFEQSAHSVCAPAAAEYFIDRARRIAESLELGIAGQSGVLLARGQRLFRSDLTESGTGTR